MTRYDVTDNARYIAVPSGVGRDVPDGGGTVVMHWQQVWWLLVSRW